MSGQRISTEYMFVVFQRETYQSVTVGTTTVQVPESSTAEAVLREMWQDGKSSESKSPHDVWIEELDRFGASVRREPFAYVDTELHEPKTVSKIRLTFPDGDTVEKLAPWVDSAIRERFVAESGEEPPPDQGLTFERWQQAVNPIISKDAVMWRCSAIHADGSTEHLPQGDTPNWSYGAPLAEVARVLSMYGNAGWSVVDANHDKGIYSGIDSGETAAPVRIRYLLARQVARLA